MLYVGCNGWQSVVESLEHGTDEYLQTIHLSLNSYSKRTRDLIHTHQNSYACFITAIKHWVHMFYFLSIDEMCNNLNTMFAVNVLMVFFYCVILQESISYITRVDDLLVGLCST